MGYFYFLSHFILQYSEKNKIFSPFTQGDSSTTRKFGGTGLGLVISKSLVEAMNGRIWFDTIYGKGTKFSFELPLKSMKKHFEPDFLEFKNKKIVIADDNEKELEYLKILFEGKGSEVICVKSGIEILENIEEYSKIVDIYLIDEEMPGMSGSGVIHYLTGEGMVLNEKIILMDYHDKKEKNITVIPKPLNFEKLLFKIVLKFGVEIENEFIKYEKDIKIKKIKQQKHRWNHRVLIVEDNEINQKMALRILEKIGFGFIDIASTGKEAVNLFSEKQYSIILMDCQMPEMSGFEATQKIREYELKNGLKRTPIIAMTAGVSDGSREKCISFGMDEYIGKPFKVDILEKILLKYIVYEIQENLEKNTIKNEEKSIYEKIKLMTGIDEQYVKEIVTEFIERLPSDILKLKAAVENFEYYSIEKQSHSFKGILRNLCFDDVAEIAFELEKRSVEKNNSKIIIVSRKLINKLENIKEIIEKDNRK